MFLHLDTPGGAMAGLVRALSSPLSPTAMLEAGREMAEQIARALAAPSAMLPSERPYNPPPHAEARRQWIEEPTDPAAWARRNSVR